MVIMDKNEYTPEIMGKRTRNSRRRSDARINRPIQRFENTIAKFTAITGASTHLAYNMADLLGTSITDRSVGLLSLTVGVLGTSVYSGATPDPLSIQFAFSGSTWAQTENIVPVTDWCLISLTSPRTFNIPLPWPALRTPLSSEGTNDGFVICVAQTGSSLGTAASLFFTIRTVVRLYPNLLVA